MFEEIIAENFPNMGKEIVTHVQEVQRVPCRINPRRNTLRHILIKVTKIKRKEKILKAINNIQGSRSKKNYNPTGCGTETTLTERQTR